MTITQYDERVATLLETELRHLGRIDRALDFGAGSGWLANRLQQRGLIREVVPTEVPTRRSWMRKPVFYDGSRLPFPDRAFELAYAVDVLHHCPDPVASIQEMARCTSRYILIKDHTYRTSLGALTLKVLDEIGNRRFGIVSPGHYQAGFSWFPTLQEQGFHLVENKHPVKCQRRILGMLTNHLQFISLWERDRVDQH